MADLGLGNLSDTDEESAVDELISQTKDLCVLEQVSKINCSGFNDSLLPSDLETRFRKLKSFPAAGGVVPKFLSSSKSELHRRRPSDDGRLNPSDGQVPKTTTAADAAKASSPLKKSSSSGEGFSENPMAVKPVSSSPSQSSNSSCIEDVIYAQAEEKAVAARSRKRSSNSKSKSKGFIGSPLGLSNCSGDSSPSPPRKPGCFWCSPKEKTVGKKKKSKENWDLDWGNDIGGGDDDDELLADLGLFSVKEQQKILNKALKEEERINKEAEKIVKWAKQASARMSYHGTEDDDDDDDDDDVPAK